MFSCSGCLTLILGFFALMFLFKFWFIILLVFFVLILVKKPEILAKAKTTFCSRQEYVSKPGEVYKECSYCHKKADRKANFCEACGRPFENM